MNDTNNNNPFIGNKKHIFLKNKKISENIIKIITATLILMGLAYILGDSILNKKIYSDIIYHILNETNNKTS